MTENERVAAESAAHLAANTKPLKAVAVVMVWDERGQVQVTHCRADQDLIDYVRAEPLEPTTPANTVEIGIAHVRELLIEHAYGKWSRGGVK